MIATKMGFPGSLEGLPLSVGQIPSGFAAEFPVHFGAIDGVPSIVSGPVGNKLNAFKVRPIIRPREKLIKSATCLTRLVPMKPDPPVTK